LKAQNVYQFKISEKKGEQVDWQAVAAIEVEFA
jgi:hypothetical protein